MKSIIIPLFLLSLVPTPALGEACGLCSGFNENLAIDLSSLEGPNGSRTRRFLQLEFEISTCAELKIAITSSPDITSDSPECAMMSLLAYSSCGCNDDPPAGSCYTCPAGGTFDGNIVPQIPGGMDGEDGDGPPSNTTCSDIAFGASFAKLFLAAFVNGMEDAFVDGMEDALGGDEDQNTIMSEDSTSEDSTSEDSTSEDFSEGNLCMMAHFFCGCDAPESGCKICEHGLENPHAIVKTDDDDDDAGEFTCEVGVNLMEMQIGLSGGDEAMCDESKEEVAIAGCVCKTEADFPTEAPAASTTMSSPDSPANSTTTSPPDSQENSTTTNSSDSPANSTTTSPPDSPANSTTMSSPDSPENSTTTNSSDSPANSTTTSPPDSPANSTTTSPPDSPENPSTLSSSDSPAFTNKNIATLLIISAATTMVAFLA